MKIGFISEGYPPLSGGVATSTQRIAKELVKLGHEVYVLSFDNTRDVTADDYCIEEEDQGVSLYRFGPFFVKNPYKSVDSIPEKYKAVLRRRVEAQMLRVLREKKVDIILTFYLLNAGFIGQMLANELNIPCVAGVRGNDIGRNIYHTSRFAVIRWVVDEADAVVCVNRHLMERTGMVFRETREKLTVIHNGLACQDMIAAPMTRTELCKKAGWAEDDLIVTFIGLLREKKGVATLASALRKVNDRESRVRLLVVGPNISGVEKLMIGDLWKSLCNEGLIYITGLIPRKEVISWASAADIICIPSLDDGMANGLLEGMSIGLCPVTTTVLGDVVTNGGNGIVTEPGDADGLAAAFETLYQDRSLISRYGENSKRDIHENYGPEQEAAAYVALFQHILEQRKQ